MDKATLKRIRLLAPGFITLMCLLPYLTLRNLRPVSQVLPDGILISMLTLGTIVIGGTYYGLDVRHCLWRGFVNRCHDNVWEKMIEPYRDDPTVQDGIGRLTKQKAMRIFYNIIDNDPSLTDQANDVRLNGAVLSTIIDGVLIGGFFGASYIVAYLVTHLRIFLWAAIAVAAMQFLLWVLKQRVSEKHIQLENEQLEVIAQFHSEKVRSQLQHVPEPH